MPAYRLLCTCQNQDGSFDIPSVDLPIMAPNDEMAILMARRFPGQAFGETNLAWLVDGSRRVIWTSVVPLPKAA